MRVDLHNHTSLCNHASGNMEEYIIQAIKLGIDVFGFSEHAPMQYDKKYRMSLDDMPFYEESIKFLQEKYSGQIQIKKSFEVDFLQDLVLDEIKNAKVDYLIGSVHFLRDKKSFWSFDDPEFIGGYENKNIDKLWLEYFEAIEQLAKSRLFDVLGHIDLLKLFKFLPKKEIKSLALGALKEVKKANMVLEINSAGFDKPIKEQYPSKDILELAFELGINITFGSDAHSIAQVGRHYLKCTKLAKDIGYKKCVIFSNKEKELVDF